MKNNLNVIGAPYWNHHLTVVEGFGCSNDHPRQFVLGEGPDKARFEDFYGEKKKSRTCVPCPAGHRDPTLELGLEKGS